MKSTEPLTLSPKKLNLDSNSARNHQKGATLNGESLPKPQLVTKMVETSEIDNNVCDTSKQTVHVHQVNGYSSEDCSKQENSVDSVKGGEVVDCKSSSNCSENRSELERTCTKLNPTSGNRGLRSETGCTKPNTTVNGGSRSELDMNCTKPNLTSRDSAVFDVDLASGDDEIRTCFEEVTSSSKGADKTLAATPGKKVEGMSLVNGYEKQSEDFVVKKLSTSVKTNGVSLVNGDKKSVQESLVQKQSTPVKSNNCVSLVNGDKKTVQDSLLQKQSTPVKTNGVNLVNRDVKSAQESLSSREIKTVSGDLERKQRSGSIFSKNGLRDSFKNMKRSIVGSASGNGLVEGRSTSKDGDEKSGVVEDVNISSRDGGQRNGELLGSADQKSSSFGVPQGSKGSVDQKPSSFEVPQDSDDQKPSSFEVPQDSDDQNPSSFGVPQGSGDQKPSSFGVPQESSGPLQGLAGVTKCPNGPHLAKASSLESLSDAGGRFERDSELRRSKSSMNGFCSGRSRSDPDEDLDDLLLPGGRQNNEGFDHLPLDSGVESAASSWDRMAESAHARLQDELRRAHHKLKLKDEEVTRLSRIRNEVEAELEELTASLFQEAHNMVREANVAQAAAEKALKESQMQIDVLTAEVAALKTLVLTSTPSRPNPHLHPQIDPKSKEDHGSNGSGLFRKQHRRSPSHFNLKYGRENSPPDSPAKEQKAPQSQVDTGDNVDMLEVDPNFHRDFMQWKQAPSLEPGDPFVARLFGEDIDTCLAFNNAPLAARVRQAISEESICIEAVNDKSRTHFPMKCALLEVIRQCHYRMKFDGCDQTYCISQLCRNRITAVCNFLNYLRYIQRGLVKSSAHEMYWEIARLRKEIALARLGLTSNQ